MDGEEEEDEKKGEEKKKEHDGCGLADGNFVPVFSP